MSLKAKSRANKSWRGDVLPSGKTSDNKSDREPFLIDKDAETGESLNPNATNSPRNPTVALEKITKESKSDQARLMKYVSLLVLVLQNSCYILMMRYSLSGENKKDYAITTAVVNAELLKIAICVVVILTTSHVQTGSLGAGLAEIHECTLGDRKEFAKMAVPAGLYTVQNWLAYVAVKRLNASTFQLLYQMKILTTAACSVLMLGRKLVRRQWAALAVLVLGVYLVQASQQPGAAAAAAAAAGPPPPGDRGARAFQEYGDRSAARDPGGTAGGAAAAAAAEGAAAAAAGGEFMVGVLAVGLACCSSGVAGVYFEKVLKGSKPSIWQRNIQLSSLGVLVGLANVYLSDGAQVARAGFYGGYAPAVWAAVALQAGGGLLVAVVVKYADNILKGFATSFSILVSVAVGYVAMGDVALSGGFVAGAVHVMGASLLYGTDLDCPGGGGRRAAAAAAPLPSKQQAAAGRTG